MDNILITPKNEKQLQLLKLLLEEMVARKEYLPFTPRTIELETSIIERESTF